jgi:hypothetical protein
MAGINQMILVPVNRLIAAIGWLKATCKQQRDGKNAVPNQASKDQFNFFQI